MQSESEIYLGKIEDERFDNGTNLLRVTIPEATDFTNKHKPSRACAPLITLWISPRARAKKIG